ncbi:MAG TPA: GFA family protein [Chthoniobacterales bacterium]|nr:GFA family protein [Chthoniobacterales bacterium]
MADTYAGTCYCGAVAIEASGAPEAMGYCHCNACRSYSGAPVGAFTLWKAGNVKVTKGEEFLGRFKSSDFSERRYCTKCGGRVMVEHPGISMADLSPATIPTLAFKPAVHLNYEETVLPMKDGLLKLRNFPAEVGGSGETMPE